MAASLMIRTTATYCHGPHYFTVDVPTPHGVAMLVDHTTAGAPPLAVLVVYDPGDPQRLRGAQPPVFYAANGEVVC